tara:strand:- start:5888 stop:7177 length:1290 start_codon:yes stop_codon:yes gene_type:complete
MAFPTLTPTSQTSAVILPATGTYDDVASTLPVGVYSESEDFLSGAAAQVNYTYRKLGGDVLDIELKAENVYANYEEAVLEYSYLLNIHQSKNALGSALGNTTGSFSHTGQFSGSLTEDGQFVSGSASNKSANVKFPKMKFEMTTRAADFYSNQASIGGIEPIYSASFDSVRDKQDYDLQSIVETAATDESSPFYNKVDNKRIFIKQVFYRTPQAMWRFYGYYGGLNVVGDLYTYGQYADDSTFQVVPTWQNKIQAVMFEDHLYTRTSHYSYEVINNKLRLFPIPTSESPDKFWIKFSIKSDAFEANDDFDDGINGVNNMGNLPFENIPYVSINSIGKQWIRRFALALSKETLGQIRGKFGGNIPIPGDSVTLNSSDLLSQAKDEQNALRDELKTILDEMTYDKVAERDVALNDSVNKVQEKIPLPVFVG